ncbi:MAG: AraC family transcriptional regulator [Leptospirales bacterium]|nr:AraC family transcriptional regulator [Leptospirales bacterium]
MAARTTIPPELIDLAERYSGEGPITDTAIDSLKIVRRDQKTGPKHSLYEPSICFVVQGEKLVTVGKTLYRCEPSRFFATAANVPVVGEVVKASTGHPYLCLFLKLNQKMVFDLVSEIGPPQNGATPEVGVFADDVSGPLTDAFLRLMRTLGNETDRSVLAPLIIKEILYYVMKSRFAHVLYQLGVKGSQMQRIFGSIERIRREFASSLTVESLARMAHMSPSAYYQKFKKVTLLSPIQFQKHIRLQEGRRLLATEVEDVTSVAFMVGYESPSQFSREYSRLFGLPPSKDIKNLRMGAGF